jgi:hypothetical protein|tara:strand:+ start:436 stop:615 length:180 start_codon:yes stop_codon:yes gene_type:complete
MEEYLIFLKMEDLLNIWTMEDDPNFLEDLIFFLNGRVAVIRRQPQKFRNKKMQPKTNKS